MATEAYWQKKAALLDDSEVGAFARFPMSDEALVGSGPQFAVNDAFHLLALGRPDDASRLLHSFLPRLVRALRRDDWSPSLLRGERLNRIAGLRKYVHLAHWLSEGRFHPLLASQAYDASWAAHRDFYPKAGPDGPSLLHLLLLKVEAGDPTGALEIYQLYEKKPISLPITDSRFARNPRSLLAAHLRLDQADSVLIGAKERFRVLATRWDQQLFPLPFVGFVEAGRILHACSHLRGQGLGPPELALLLR